MKQLWQRICRPSLMRRLLLAQMVLLSALWSAGLVLLATESSRDTVVLDSTAQFDALLAMADSLIDDPVRLRQVMRKADLASISGDNMADIPNFTPKFVLDHRGKVLYQSDHTPAGVRPARLDRIETIDAGGKRWRARTRRSPETDARVTVIVPADSFDILVTLNSRGIYLLPLLVSLPILALPAWLSIHLALRPWRKVAAEVASRGPHDLRPLAFRPPHQELAAMADSIDALMQRVSGSAARERAFIADAAHELRTPLAAMRVNVEALQRQTGDVRQQELLEGILRSARRAGRLVGQLLTLMRSDVQETEAVQPVQLDSLLQERMAALSGIAHVAGVELELLAEHNVQVLGRRDSLTSMIDNLIENGIKYSPRGATVSVCLEASAERALLLVRDHGRGIPSELRNRVFDRFYRDPNQSETGSGLGLAIVKSVVLQHGGTIVLCAAPDGTGLLVKVSLPRMDSLVGFPLRAVPVAGREPSLAGG